MFDTTFVEIDLVVDKILEVSQTGEFMSAKMVMKQRWVDNRLGWFSKIVDEISLIVAIYLRFWKPLKAWNESDYAGIQYLHVPIGILWQPEIILYNNIDGQFFPSLDDVPALVESSGTVKWNPPSVYTAGCNIKVKQFPYDIQRCSMLFRSMTYEYPDIVLIRSHNKGMD